ncbi:M23 family metallopeptidase, partial [bacterium]|nr:M23 family metallopeptidase [bacterium]
MLTKKILILLSLFVTLSGQDTQWPTDAGNSYSSNFGEYRDDHFHMGLDIRTKGTIGHKVFAVENGYISKIITNYSGYGKAIYQKTISGKTIVYAHLDKFSPIMERVVKLQQAKNKRYSIKTNFSSNEFRLQKGDIIGYSGDTGYAFGPNLHFEVRDKSDAALDPLKNGYLAPDKINPIMQKIALIPLSKGALVNSSPLVQTMPLFRDKNGTYLFADTISVIGDFGIAIQAVDKREGSKFKYQFHKAELFIDNKPVFTLNYNRIPYSQTNNVRTLVQFELKKQNLGEYQKLYRLTEHPKMSVHGLENNGIISVSPGYHKIRI